MTIDEALKIIKDGRIVATIIKGNNENDTKFNQENIEALNTIVDTMRKYQKIEKVLERNWNIPSHLINKPECLDRIMETYREMR